MKENTEQGGGGNGGGGESGLRVETFRLRDDGTFPNSRFPLIILREATQWRGRDPATVFEECFAKHDWGNSWRDGIYPYHHYHSTAHEVLGVFRGWARVQFGGESGVLQNIFTRDVVIIPAGVAHKNAGSSEDFLVLGAYAGGRDWDIKRGVAGERPEADENIRQVPMPKCDPVMGEEGPLRQLWQ
jgi:uncharacterized protein YjlB